MMELSIPKRLILLCQMTLAESKSAVRINKKPFNTTQGFRQGDALSCNLFNICLEVIVRRDIRTSSTIITRSVQLLAYAEDMDIASRNINDLKTSYTNISSSAASIGLKINIEKTKYMKASRNASRLAWNNLSLWTSSRT